MKRLLITFSLLLSLTATYAASFVLPWSHGNLMVSANHRFLQHADGTPFFWLGNTAWLLPERLDRNESQFFLSRCHDAGYNVVLVQVLNDVPSVNVYGALSNPCGWDMSKADPEGTYSYWDHLDYIVDQAARNGIYVGMVAIWGSQLKNGNINAEQAKTYGEFLANRYKDKPNIIWFMGGDIQGDIHPEIWNAMAAAIKSIDHNHLMTYHPRGRYTSAHWWSKAQWIDFHTFQSGHRRYGQRMGNKTYPIPDSTEEDNWQFVDSTWAYSPVKPVLDAEPSYEDIPKGLHDFDEPHWQACDVRRYAYWSVFAGSCGHTYGHNAIMQMFKPGFPPAYGRDGDVKPWYKAVNDPGFNQMKYLKQLMLSLPYYDRVPDQSVIVGKNGVRYDRLIATRGKDYLLVYNYNSDPMDIDLRKISGKEKKVWWMDAATGKRTFLGTYKNGVRHFSRRNPHPDQPDDGVLIAVDAGKYSR